MDPKNLKLDENSNSNDSSVYESIKAQVKQREQDLIDSHRLSVELEPVINKIYTDAGKPLPWRYE